MKSECPGVWPTAPHPLAPPSQRGRDRCYTQVTQSMLRLQGRIVVVFKNLKNMVEKTGIYFCSLLLG